MSSDTPYCAASRSSTFGAITGSICSTSPTTSVGDGSEECAEGLPGGGIGQFVPGEEGSAQLRGHGGKPRCAGSYRADAQGFPAARRSWGKQREKVWSGEGLRGKQRPFGGMAQPGDAEHTRNYRLPETRKCLSGCGGAVP